MKLKNPNKGKQDKFDLLIELLEEKNILTATEMNEKIKSKHKFNDKK